MREVLARVENAATRDQPDWAHPAKMVKMVFPDWKVQVAPVAKTDRLHFKPTEGEQALGL